MGKFSGAADLYDHIMMRHLRTKSGSDKKEDLEKESVLYSDELECFNEFKKETGGVIHQHKKIEVNINNQKLIEQKCNKFKIVEHIEKTKTGKEKITYTYMYYDKEYKTLKELNKKGVYITLEIYFDTILDLIPYYPYTIGVCCSNETGEYVVISSTSEVQDHIDRCLRSGIDTDINYRNKQLQQHYIEVVQRYYIPKQENIVFELVEFDKNHIGKLKNRIDDRFEVKWFFKDGLQPHWCEPKVIDYEVGLIKISEADYDKFLGHQFYVKYCKYEKPRLYLD